MLNILFSFICAISHSAEDISSVIKKMNENYVNSKNYRVNSHYKLFKGHDSGNLIEQYKGFTENSEYGFYQKIGESEKIITKDFYLHISHPERALVYGFPISFNFNQDVQGALKLCTSAKLEVVGSDYILTFSYQNGANFEFSKIKLVISKDEYLLKAIDMYYSTLTDFSTKFSQTDYEQPHLQIIFSNYKNSVEMDRSYFNLSNFLKIGEDHILKTVGTCSGYELIDIRTNQ